MSANEDAPTAPDRPFEETRPADAMQFMGPHPAEPPSAALITAAPRVCFRVEEDGTYLGLDANGWTCFGTDKTTSFTPVRYEGTHYIVVASSPLNDKYKGYYLSYSYFMDVGVYRRWFDARYWNLNPLDSAPYPGLYRYRWFERSRYNLRCNGISAAMDDVITLRAEPAG